MNLSIDVISDVICPWCYIGKRRLEKAIVAYGQPVKVNWHPFQLNPTMPKEGIGRREYRIGKFGSWERSMELDANIVTVGEQEGIQFDFDRMERTPNTLDAHQLIWLSNKDGTCLVLELARPNHLEHSSQNATVVDHAIEHSVHELSITNRQRDQQSGRHVLHERLLTSVQSQLRQVLVVIDFVDQLQNFVELRLSRAVERVTERTRSGNLSHGVPFGVMVCHLGSGVPFGVRPCLRLAIAFWSARV